MEIEIIKVNDYKDYKYFGSVYTEKMKKEDRVYRPLREEYKDSIFEFHFTKSFFFDEQIIKGYKAIINEYGFERIRTVFETNIADDQEFEIIKHAICGFDSVIHRLPSVSFQFTYDSSVFVKDHCESAIKQYESIFSAATDLSTKLVVQIRLFSSAQGINGIMDIDAAKQEICMIEQLLFSGNDSIKNTVSYEVHIDAKRYANDLNRLKEELEEFITSSVKAYGSERIRTHFEIEVYNNLDYSIVFQIASELDSGIVSVPKWMPYCTFDFAIIVNENTIDELLLHDYILLYLRAPSLRLRLNIVDGGKLKNNDYYRIASYISGCKKELRQSITFNDDANPIFFAAQSFGKILPAIPIDDEGVLEFLGEPLNEVDLKYVLSEYPQFDNETTSGLEYSSRSLLSYKESLLNACRRYLMWGKFDYRVSTCYQYVRKKVFQSKSFRAQIRSVPFLALLLFAQYDYYYRSSIIKEYKERINEKKDLDLSDVIPDFQPFQDFDRFIVYEDMCKEHMDIKSLLYYSLSSLEKKDNQTKKWITLPEENKIMLHQAIISALFEAKTLAEGLLQLIENAFYHANGGLLSIRIREYARETLKIATRKPYPISGEDDVMSYSKAREYRDTAFLTNKYKNYFNSLKEALDKKSGKRFYLEVKISDLSEVNMKDRFFKNAKDRANGILSESAEVREKLQAWYKKYNNQCSDKGVDDIFSLFYCPSDVQEELWKDYYDISSNRVHHFGLQIFDSVLRSKNGGLCVCGHNRIYNNPQYSGEGILCENELDIRIPGTSYRILLPLNHESILSNNVIVDTSFDRLLQWKEMESFRHNNSQIIKQILINDLYGEYNSHSFIPNREKRVEVLANMIKKQISNTNPKPDGKYLIVFSFNDMLNGYKSRGRTLSEEELIKGILLFLLKWQEDPHSETLPVAIIGLSSTSLLEVTRIIALFYDKKGEPTERMKNIQIYLKGNKVGEEILFAGNNINQTADRITRLALTRGNSAEYFSIAQSLLSRRKTE